jgi:DNA (cytosine-5)-methyltransferase 1
MDQLGTPHPMKPARRFPTRRPIAVDLFSGAGGMSMGFEQAGFDIVFSSDRDAYHVATHKRNFPYGVAHCASIIDLTGAAIRRAAHIDGEVDLVFGGPPCQGFSNMGLRDAGDPRNSLLGEFIRIVEELRPKSFVMENVPGMQQGATKPILDAALAQFRKAGYRIVTPLQVLNAADFGVPQARQRLIVLGLREDIDGALEYPQGPATGQPKRPTVREALEDLPSVDALGAALVDDTAKYPRQPRSAYARVLRGLDVDPTDLSRPRRWNKNICTCVTKVKHGPAARSLYSSTRPGTMVPGHKLPRLDPDGLSPTLRAGSDSERGSHTAPRPVHYSEPRCITAREAARIHGYPDWFVFYPGKWHAYRQIGNSVCPPVARAVGRQIAAALGVKYGRTAQALVDLPSEFGLAEARPRAHRRLVHAVEFAKVVEALFEARFDPSKQALRKNSGFTADDVSTVVAATGAEMPRVRAERFVEELARSRNFEEILRLPNSLGYTVRRCDGRAIGEFVPVGTANALGESDYIRVRSRDLNATESFSVHLTAEDGSISREAMLLLEKRNEYATVLGLSRGSRLRLPRGLFGIESASHYRLENGRGAAALLVVSDGPTLPLKSRIGRLLKQERLNRCVLLAPLTRRHMLLVGLEVTHDQRIKEVARQTFEAPGVHDQPIDAVSAVATEAMRTVSPRRKAAKSPIENAQPY